MLAQTGLGDRAGEEVGRLSGGNQQRVNIAIGLLSDPPVLLLDEPSASLDPRQRERLWEFIGGLAGRGTTVVFSTHNVAEAERYADRVLVLGDGELLFTGTPAELERATVARRAAPRLRGGVRPLPARARPLTADALAAHQGPADPQALAAARGAADRLPDGDRADDRLRAVQPPGEAAGWPATTRCRPGAGEISIGGQQIDIAQLRQPAVRVDQPIKVNSREEAIAKVRNGEALGGADHPGGHRRPDREPDHPASAARRSRSY